MMNTINILSYRNIRLNIGKITFLLIEKSKCIINNWYYYLVNLLLFVCLKINNITNSGKVNHFVNLGRLNCYK